MANYCQTSFNFKLGIIMVEYKIYPTVNILKKKFSIFYLCIIIHNYLICHIFDVLFFKFKTKFSFQQFIIIYSYLDQFFIYTILTA